MIIHAHRGIGYGKKENTLEAYRTALKQGHGIEIDVRQRSNGQIVIKHDPLITGDILPTLDDVFTLTIKHSALQRDIIAIHLKAEEQNEKMIKTLVSTMLTYNAHTYAFIFDVMRPAIDAIRLLSGDVRLAISIGAEHHTESIYTIDDISKFSDIDLYWMDEWTVPYSVNNEALYKQFKADGKTLYAISPDVALQNNHPWATDGKYIRMWKNLIRWGVDGICTDVPCELDTVVNSYSVKVV